VHVLLPRSYDESRRYRVLYILPVVCGELDGVPAWGRPLDVAIQHGFADTHNVIVVMVPIAVPSPEHSVRESSDPLRHARRELFLR
jgi:hypothetical protein